MSHHFRRSSRFSVSIPIFLFFVIVTFPGQSAFSQTEGARDVYTVIKKIEKAMSGVRTMSTGFRQTKRMKAFTQPLVLSGEIDMEEPGRFAWRVLEPVKYTAVIDSDRLSQWNNDSGKVEEMDLSSVPGLNEIVRQLRVWFQGSYGALEATYRIQLISEDPVTLRFIPGEEAPSYGMIQKIELSFSEDLSRLKSLVFEEVSGDTSKLVFHETRLNEPIDKMRWKADLDEN